MVDMTSMIFSSSQVGSSSSTGNRDAMALKALDPWSSTKWVGP